MSRVRSAFCQAKLAAAASVALATALFASGCDSASAPNAAVADAAGSQDAASVEVAADVTQWVAPATLALCQGPIAYRYAPSNGLQFTTFPDDYWTRDEQGQPTGLQVDFPADRAPWIAPAPPILRFAMQDLQTLDGWGTQAGVTLQFTAPITTLPSYATPSTADDLQMWDLTANPPALVPFEVETTDEGKTLIAWPLRPLQPRHQHALLLRRPPGAMDSACVAQPPALTDLLFDTASADAPTLRMRPRYQQALKALNLQGQDVSAMVLFTTQSTWQKSLDIAKDIASRDYKWASKPVCKAEKRYQRCDLTLQAADYRAGRTVADGKPVAWYTLPVALWLPLDTPPPWPVMIFGHGLGSPRTQAKELADRAAPAGFATIAIDAVRHGEHPAGANPGTIGALLGFFAISTESLAVDGLQLRDNWRQSTYDKLQLLRAIAAHPDLDDDGKAELRADKIAYVGVSLGGIMGPEFLALQDRVSAAVLSVPGARVGTIIRDSEQFGPLIAALKPDGYGDGDVARFFPILQTLLDAGDSGVYAPFVLRDRLLPGMAPQLLMQMAIPDEIVPNSATRALARAMDIPHAAPVVQPVELLQVLPALPAVGNLATGLTAALFQFDRLREDPDGKVQPASHSDLPGSEEAVYQDLVFLQAWLQDGVGKIVDPLLEMQTPPLP